ncbi:retrotransposon-related protein [Tanacetum coccineum]
MDVLKFSGVYPESWIFAITKYFSLLNTPDDHWLKIVGFNLEGAAAEWFQWMTRNGLIITWARFEKSVRNYFGPSEYEDPNGVLSKLLQLRTVKDYQWEFGLNCTCNGSCPVTPTKNEEAIESGDTSILNSLFGHESPRSLQFLGTLGTGVYTESWIFTITEYFSLLHNLDDQWLKIVDFNLEGAAAEWFQWMTRNDPNGVLSKLLQLGTVKDYQWEFEKLVNRATDIPDSLLISYYISGLKLHLQRELLVSRPTTLGDAFSLALITDARLDDQVAPVASTTTKTFGNNGGDES